MIDITDFLLSFVTLLVIMDPIASLPVFIDVTKKFKPAERVKAAFTATFVAYTVLVVFIFFGLSILSVFNIPLSSFRIAGGILIFIIAVRMLFKEEADMPRSEVETALMLIAVPLITGPGAITTAILLITKYGILTVFLAATSAAAFIFGLLYSAGWIEKVVSRRALQLMVKVMMLLLASIAVEFIKTGILEVMKTL
ncbi:hypothetical protein COT30_00765 [Candidatus Micrarchaeota archaeon CG08_land_8_20_14_0_20_49_17]|nr:MAG: hypothetical protein COT30_00765 [Candidatus Micrarchaeota archaeon CG08_land_8_20_14_0_20_49_17]PIZ98359.1 MAG: hypothetical protein COX84_02085 [Candidatus Micrarchaeota archaeon CG_4_10_14_0_2_um_filter_49_7]HII54324.1 MarC family protein [Candidatus Micrarchaeota archaeon]